MIGQDTAGNQRCISGADLRQMLAVGTTLLEENVEHVNSLNVFPVPDGDTGTNMLLTMQSAMQEVSRTESSHLGTVAHAAAHGSLMGARGNSGVILSQILRGIARASEGLATLDAHGLAIALKEGANTAYRGIGKPVEGTILTVARECADAAVAAAQREKNPDAVLREVVEAGRRSVESTPELLPTLKEAGVVDAGGQGYLLILEGALMFATGERSPNPAPRARKLTPRPPVTGARADYGYCTEVQIRGSRLGVDVFRDRLERLGSSVIVVGDEDVVHLHVHTHRPGDVLNLASEQGSLDRVKVENMEIQHTAYAGGKVTAQPVLSEGIGAVAVAAGAGLARVFQDLGAAAVVHGGQTMNPSIEDLVRGIEYAGISKAILLPNNPNVILTAQQSQALVRTELRVVPTRTMCEGIAAMVAFNPQVDLEANVAAMGAAAGAVQTIELTRAVRSTRTNGLQVREGQAIGLLDGALVEAGDGLVEVARRVLERARVADHEVVTIYRGEGVSAEEGEGLAASLRSIWPAVQVEVVDGGQPHYPYIISVE